MTSGRLIKGFASLIGDVVSSREHVDRATLQGALEEALAAANAEVASLQPLTPTLGDEFQGVYAGLGEALGATLLVRLALAGEAEVRFGIGWGAIQTLEPGRGALGQDGPAWWAAREAVDRVRRSVSRRGKPRGTRTMFALGEGGTDPFAGRQPGSIPRGVEPLVNAHLVTRDELVARMDPRDARIALGLIRGHSATELAAAEGVTQPAISQRAISGGAYAIVESHRLLGEGIIRP